MMRMPDWIKKGIGLVIASLGLWNGLLTSANAQAGNVVVYVAGNNPVTLNITRKVVTNPIVTLVNGKTRGKTGAACGAAYGKGPWLGRARERNCATAGA